MSPVAFRFPSFGLLRPFLTAAVSLSTVAVMCPHGFGQCSGLAVSHRYFSSPTSSVQARSSCPLCPLCVSTSIRWVSPLPVLAEFAIDLLELLVRVVRQGLGRPARLRLQTVEGDKSDVPLLGAAHVSGRLYRVALDRCRHPPPFGPAGPSAVQSIPALQRLGRYLVAGGAPHMASSSSPIRSSTNMCAQQAFRSSWPCGRMCA